MRTASKAPLLGALALAATLTSTVAARAEPTEPIVVGWWSYFSNTKVPTPSSPQHTITGYGDEDTYYFEPSGGHGLQEDPAVLPKAQAWQNMIDYILANSNGVTLQPEFSINTSSDLQSLQEAYFGWALVLLYVPKDKYCDDYKIHIDMVEYGSNPPKLVLRPGINEVILIHEDQAAVERYVTNVWIEHNGQKVPLAPKNVSYGRITDVANGAPLYEATVGISGNGVTDTFLTGPLGFYLFPGLADGQYALTADHAKYKSQMGNVTVQLGQAATEVVRTDFPLEMGCSCPNGTMCGPSGGCLDPCIPSGELSETCEDPTAVCFNGFCYKNPCDTLVCKAGFDCQVQTFGDPPVDYGICVELACSNVCCAAGEVCSAGLCVTDNCGAGCPQGQTCAGGTCVDSCTVLTCAAPLVCKDGLCIDPCVADPSSPTCTGAGGSGGGIDLGGGGSGGATGGTSAGGSAGSANGGGGNGATSGNGSSGGCGCRTSGDSQSGLAWTAALGALAVVLARRRRAQKQR